MSSRNNRSVEWVLGIAVISIIASLIVGAASESSDDTRKALATGEVVALAERLSERRIDTYGEGAIEDFTGVLTTEHLQNLLGRSLSKDYDFEVSLEDGGNFSIAVTKAGSLEPFLTYHSADGLVVE